jgi:hypothetical protein
VTEETLEKALDVEGIIRKRVITTNHRKSVYF